jgi:hypothetical protein
MPKTRKNDSADQKVAICRRHLSERDSVADLYDELQIQPGLDLQLADPGHRERGRHQSAE